MEIELMDESDLENYDLNNILDNDEENDDIIAEVEKADCIEYDDPLTSTVVKGQWVLVKFALKTSVKHYVGVVTELNCEGKPTINYVRKSRHRGSEDKTMFVFPQVPDICELRHLEDIVCKLPDPMTGRRGQIFFKITFHGYNVQ
ncbi:unnamed protein product [Parnassius apollo]|uniref:(apollo) hypothetical protein n=1 Tax=Parnassius apollo TaxID=110799 RepID=A0A8S3W893_PARAO|nr:unnamed protein product [Parnassius apollo]